MANLMFRHWENLVGCTGCILVMGLGAFVGHKSRPWRQSLVEGEKKAAVCGSCGARK